MGELVILAKCFLFPFIAVLGIHCGLIVASMLFGPININVNHKDKK